MSVYTACIVLIAIGLYCIVVKRNLVKIIIGFAILEYAVNLFLAVVGYRKLGLAPIVIDKSQPVPFSVDPLPQALVLTAIVIGLGVMALMIAIAYRLYEKYGTFDVAQIRRLRG
ncbi:cation:proton antiporter [candidate division TA06 bacterium DG_26]|uniref:Cation:proton antiporter n=1 Tax=candidate division TA06 bacterium DG_26 TaxID=1703771 RepID=A0A0S7WHF0_UNCT6|nr:MAG: cation:proton antiporter [candidate division TA06 bacterium DG_26]